VVTVNSTAFTLTTKLFGVGKSKEYLVAKMRDIRFQSQIGAGRSTKPSRIAFDYGAKTIGFADDIEEAEAANLIAQINQHCQIASTPTPQQGGIKFWRQQ
jgi:hypothetical protein